MPLHNGARFNGLPSSFPGQLPATATNDDAPAGRLGEIIESTVLVGAAVSLTVSGTAYNITSISLTAGDWDVWGSVSFAPNAATTISGLAAAISTTSATFPTAPGAGAFVSFNLTFTTGNNQTIPAGTRRISVASTTTVYLVGAAGFAVNVMSGYGYIGARRVR